MPEVASDETTREREVKGDGEKLPLTSFSSCLEMGVNPNRSARAMSDNRSLLDRAPTILGIT